MSEFKQLNCLTTLSAGKWLNLTVLKFSEETVLLIIAVVKYPQIEAQ